MAFAIRATAVLAFTLAILPGCSGGSGLKTHPVEGKVEIKEGDIAQLTGSFVEFMPDNDEPLRPSGKLAADGTFSVKTLYQGEILPGAPEGRYKARIILGDESDEDVPKRKGEVIHRRFLNFDSSGLSFTVPSDDYTIVLSRK